MYCAQKWEIRWVMEFQTALIDRDILEISIEFQSVK